MRKAIVAEETFASVQSPNWFQFGLLCCSKKISWMHIVWAARLTHASPERCQCSPPSVRNNHPGLRLPRNLTKVYHDDWQEGQLFSCKGKTKTENKEDNGHVSYRSHWHCHWRRATNNPCLSSLSRLREWLQTTTSWAMDHGGCNTLESWGLSKKTCYYITSCIVIAIDSIEGWVEPAIQPA